MYKIEDFNKVATEMVDWIKVTFEEKGKKNAVLGISGGTDSTVLAGALVKALGKDHVFGIFMPNGTQADIEDAYRAAKEAGVIFTCQANLELAVKAAEAVVLLGSGHDSLNSQQSTNLTPRVRTAVEYCIAQGIEDSLVVCTANLSELMMGYFTMWADMGSVAPLAKLTKTEVRKVGLALGLPEDLVLKTPADGLCGKSDEEKMGFRYEDIDNFIRKNLDAVPEGVKIALESRITKMAFKRKMLNIDSYTPQLTGVFS